MTNGRCSRAGNIGAFPDEAPSQHRPQHCTAASLQCVAECDRPWAPYHTIPYHTTPYHAIPFNAISFYNIPNHTMLSHTLWTPYHTRPTGPHGPYHTIWSPYTRLPGHHHRIARPSCTPIPSTNWVPLKNKITKSYKDRHPHYLTSTFRAG